MGRFLIVAFVCFYAAACAPDDEQIREPAPEGSGVSASAPVGVVASTEDNRCGHRIDTNQNGLVEEVKYLSFGFAFDNWDVHDDMSVTPAEFARCWPTLPFRNGDSAFRTFDQDNSGSLSEDEFFAREDYAIIAPLKDQLAGNAG